MTARVLVVDDILPNVKVLSAKLLSEYYEVLQAFSGQEALDKIEKEMPDIVLLDVMMPGMDGFEVCDRIKNNPVTMHIPVVMVTALSDISDRVRGLQVGADDFLTKPVNDLALFSRVRSLVRLKMVIDEWRLRETTSDQLGVIQATSMLEISNLAGCRVLVVDDLPVEAQKFAQVLHGDEYEVINAANGTEAMNVVGMHDLDMIVISLTLNGEDGLRLCSQIRSQEKTRQIPILLVDDNSDFKRTVKGLDLGANDYILRPFDKQELLARCRSQLKRKKFQDKLRANYETSLSMALVDSLTGLYNRRYLNAHLERMLEQREGKRPLTILICDIDKFKSVNDTHGHPVGDEVLVEFSKRAVNAVRAIDLVSRMGGEEFVVILPDSNEEQAKMVAERIRLSIEAAAFSCEKGAKQLNVTVSIGGATAREGEAMEQLMQRADESLYRAKNEGRNRVIMAE